MDSKTAKNIATSLLVLAVFAPAYAKSPLEIDFKKLPTGGEYQEFAEPLVSPLRYHFLTPANGTGIMGFDAGIAVTASSVPDSVSNVAKEALDNGKSFPSKIYIPRLTIQKGLPLGVDVGMNAVYVPRTRIRLLGAGLQYQIDLPVPAVPLRAAARAGYTTLLGMNEISATNLNMEGLISLGFPPGISAIMDVEPYAGFGTDFANAESEISYYDETLSSTEKKTLSADWSDSYILAGVRFSLGFLRLTGEAQYSVNGLPLIYSGKIAVGF